MSGYPPPPDPPQPMPSGSYPPPPDVPPKKSMGLGVGIAIGAVIVLLLALLGGGAVFVAKKIADNRANDEVVTVMTEPVSTAANPFSPPPTQPGQASTDVTVTNPVTTPNPVTVKGGNAGLFGGTQKTSQCDKAKLIAFLNDNPAKASEWARVEGIAATDIAAFVNKQTQLILRSDTRVTNHGWENGSLTTFQSVLQNGTAVLVNDYGMPTVKCYCGNPLSAPSNSTRVSYHGTTWTGWNPQSITIIEQNVTVINDFTVVNVYTGEPFGRPAGTDGTDDGPAPATTGDETTTPTPAPGPEINSGEEAGAYVKQAVITKLRKCAAKIGVAAEFEKVLQGLTFTGTATSDPNIWTVSVTDKSGTYTWTVNAETGKVTAANSGAQEIDAFCASQ